MDRITLKNVKYAAFASEETSCYEASVYFDGKKVGTVKNDGHGGCDYEYPTDKEGWIDMVAYIETLPSEVVEWDDRETFEMKQSLESICSALLDKHLISTDLKRALSKKVLFKKASHKGIFETKTAPNKAVLAHWVKQIESREDVSVVLNSVSFEDALNIYAS